LRVPLAHVTSVRVVVLHDLVLICNDIAKITARRRGYEICRSVAKKDPDALPSDPINIQGRSKIQGKKNPTPHRNDLIGHIAGLNLQKSRTAATF
jgi:hypothetical protein